MASMLKVSSRGTVTLPKRLRARFGVKSGGQIVAEETPLGVLLRGGRKSAKIERYTPARLQEFAAGERELEVFLKRQAR